MRSSLSGVKTRVERLVAHYQAAATDFDWDKGVAMLSSARTARGEPKREMTPEEFAAWSGRLRTSVRGTSQEKLAERLISAHQRGARVEPR